MEKVTLKTIDAKLDTLVSKLEKRFDGIDGQLNTTHTHLDIIYTKLKEHDQRFAEQDDLLHLIADRVSRHDDDLTYIKKSLQHQRA